MRSNWLDTKLTESMITQRLFSWMNGLLTASMQRMQRNMICYKEDYLWCQEKTRMLKNLLRIQVFISRHQMSNFGQGPDDRAINCRLSVFETVLILNPHIRVSDWPLES